MIHSLWMDQVNPTLGSLMAIILLVAITAGICVFMGKLQPTLESRALLRMATSHSDPWPICPQMFVRHEYGASADTAPAINMEYGKYADTSSIINGINMTCANQTWEFDKQLLSIVAARAFVVWDRTNSDRAYCYQQSDLVDAVRNRYNITGLQVADAICIHFASNISNTIGDPQYSLRAEFHDMMAYGPTFVARFADHSPTPDGPAGRLDFVFENTSWNGTEAFKHFLQYGLDDLLKDSPGLEVVNTTLKNETTLGELRQCLDKKSRVVLNITRTENWSEFSCPTPVIDWTLGAYQQNYDLMKNNYRAPGFLFYMSYDNLYACYTAILGALIGGCFVFVANLVYHLSLMVALLWADRLASIKASITASIRMKSSRGKKKNCQDSSGCAGLQSPV